MADTKNPAAKVDRRLEIVEVVYTNPDPKNIPEVGPVYIADYPIEFVDRKARMKRCHAEVLVKDRANRVKFRIVE